MIDEFEIFWQAYPKKLAKGDCRKAWNQTAKIRPPLPEILAALDAAKKCEQWTRDGGQWICYGATWLRAERWSDVHEVQTLKEHETKPWHETWEGIRARGLEFNLKESDFDHPTQFKAAVFEAARRAQH